MSKKFKMKYYCAHKTNIKTFMGWMVSYFFKKSFYMIDFFAFCRQPNKMKNDLQHGLGVDGYENSIQVCLWCIQIPHFMKKTTTNSQIKKINFFLMNTNSVKRKYIQRIWWVCSSHDLSLIHFKFKYVDTVFYETFNFPAFFSDCCKRTKYLLIVVRKRLKFLLNLKFVCISCVSVF